MTDRLACRSSLPRPVVDLNPSMYMQLEQACRLVWAFPPWGRPQALPQSTDMPSHRSPPRRLPACSTGQRLVAVRREAPGMTWQNEPKELFLDRGPGCATHAGTAVATATAIAAPIEWPTRWARASPSLSVRVRTMPAKMAMSSGPTSRLDSRPPGRSVENTRSPFAICEALFEPRHLAARLVANLEVKMERYAAAANGRRRRP